MPGHAVLQVPRQRPLTLVARASVRFIASGHLHQYRARHQGDIEYIWAPSTAFLIADRLPDAVSELGFIALTLRSDGDYAHEFVKAPELRAHNLDALKGHGQYRYLRDIPVEAVGEIMTRHAIVAVV